MDQRFYRTGQFARKAAVSIRTLRYYDKEGLLAPSRYSESGYRLYTDRDLVDLQQILALKFLGLSLDEIKALMRPGRTHMSLQEVLDQQKRMMEAKRSQLDNIIQAISEAEKLLRSSECDWNSLVNVIQAIQMEQNRDWVKKYFTPEQMEQMQKLTEESYSEEARASLASRGEWTEADQEQATAGWNAVNSDIARLASEDADPAGAEAQDVAARYSNLISAFTGGNPEVAGGLNKWWQNYGALSEEQKPFKSPYTAEQRAWVDKALEVYRQNNR